METHWVYNVNWAYIKLSKDVLDVFWTSYIWFWFTPCVQGEWSDDLWYHFIFAIFRRMWQFLARLQQKPFLCLLFWYFFNKFVLRSRFWDLLLLKARLAFLHILFTIHISFISRSPSLATDFFALKSCKLG